LLYLDFMPVLWLLPGQWIGWQSRLLREFTEGNLVIDGAGKLGGDKGGAETRLAIRYRHQFRVTRAQVASMPLSDCQRDFSSSEAPHGFCFCHLVDIDY